MKSFKKEKVWSLVECDAQDERQIRAISEKTGLSDICAKLVYNRGYRTPEQATSFLSAEISALHDPFLMKDMDKAVERIKQAVINGEMITIYGDYDVDGVTAVTVAYLYIKSLGGIVNYYIPSREKEGYGLSHKALDFLSKVGTKLIVTVDTGITAVEEAEYAAELGMEMVITDHHECHASIPDAVAVVNPHRPDCTYPFAELAGVGVIFKLVCACEIAFNEECDPIECVQGACDEFIDLVAIGTVADVMPLIDENRYIVKRGLEQIGKTGRVGLEALIDASNNPTTNGVKPAVGDAPKKKRKINAGFIGYGLAPRINAAGRISNAEKAVELLLSETYAEAEEKALELCEINLRRQLEENRIAEQAYKIIEQTHDFEHDKVIVISDDTWQQGIVGIVSSRVTEKYGLPSILISFDGATRGFSCLDDVGKGSGRSIKGLNLVDALSHCEEFLIRYGGHELAAGLTIMRCDIDRLRQSINEYANECLSDDKIGLVKYEADCELSLGDVSMNLAQEINELEPFGVANRTPDFLIRGLTVQRIISMGAGKHTKLILTQGQHSVHALYFGMPTAKLDIYCGEMVDLICQININEFRNVSTVQLLITDIRLSLPYAKYLADDTERYEKVRSGDLSVCTPSDIPDRADVGDIFRLLRNETNQGQNMFSDRSILNTIGLYSLRRYGLLKIKLILDVLSELNIIDLDVTVPGCYMINVNNRTGKTNLESSELYNRLLGLKKA